MAALWYSLPPSSALRISTKMKKHPKANTKEAKCFGPPLPKIEKGFFDATSLRKGYIDVLEGVYRAEK